MQNDFKFLSEELDKIASKKRNFNFSNLSGKKPILDDK